MPVYIYNSLTRKKEELIPLSPPQISMYVCGPTVYDEPHIGHVRSAYIFDVMRRYLAYRGYRVKFVRNVTDVDDKIIDKARKEFPGRDLKQACEEVAAKYLEAYHQALEDLGIDAQDKIIEPKASDYIPKMVDFIQCLIEKGVAYASGGDVYFDISKAKNYGKLSRQDLDKMEAGARVSPTENKKNPLDFALWKSAKENEPSWISRWGKGRPGWHIECSVMSSEILGDEFDIHGGGMDLIFPHHENEIAQSEGAGKKFARAWIHHGLLTINGQKMAKSLGNFITVAKVLKEYHPDVLKLFFLQALYSSPIDFSERTMKEETQRYKSFVRLFSLYKNYSVMNLNKAVSLGELSIIEEYKLKFINAMDDNFNTPQALAALEQLKSYAYSLVINDGIERNWPKFKHAVTTIDHLLDRVFNIHPDRADLIVDLRLVSEDSELRNVIAEALKDTESIRKLIDERIKLKKEKQFAKADKIRKDLEARGIILEDRKDGTTEWRWK